MGAFRRYRDTVLVIVLLAVPFFFLRASIRNPQNLNVVDRALLGASAPIEYAASALARGISNLVGEYAYLVAVKADNNKLSYENARLRAELNELKQVRSENRRLERLLGLRDSLGTETVSALVIAKDTTDYFRVTRVILDNPAPEIRANMPVLSVNGVVGTVKRVAGDKIDVRLAVDSGFGVDVIVQRTEARGFVRGGGELSRYTARVELVKRTDEVEVGDILVTSGYGCRFPKGIEVAKVTNVVKKDFGIYYQSIEAEPLVDFSRLEEVLIVLDDNQDCSPRPRAER